MKNNRKIRSAAAVLMAAALFAGCSNVSENETDILTEPTFSDTETVSETESVTSDATAVPTESSVTSDLFGTGELSLPNTDLTAEETASDTTEETDEESEDTELSEETSETTSRSWSETISSGTMYVTEDCVGREGADDNAAIITKFYKGQAVEILALTDSGFYKVKGGSYVHPEYLTDNPPVSETETETETTTESETEETTKTTKKKRPSTTTSASESDTADETSTAEVTDENEISFDTAVDFKNRYAYKQLNASEKELYEDIYNAVKNFEPAVTLESDISRVNAIKVYMIVFNEEPQFFWMGSTVTVNGNIISLSYKAEKKEAEKMQQEIETAAAPVLAKINAATSTYDKLKIMYDYIILHNDAEVDSAGFNATIYNAFKADGKIQCAGYAKTIQYFCDLSGIESTVVVGRNAQNGSHAWNVVYCGDGYYNLDCTWGDPINDFDNRYLRYTYFLVPDSEIHNVSHFDINSFFLSDGTKITCFTPPACTNSTYNYYKREKLYFSDIDSADAAMKAAIEKAVANKENTVQIRVSDEKLFEQMTNGSAAAAYQKYAKSLSPSVKGIQKFTTDSYKKTGVVIFDIRYNN